MQEKPQTTKDESSKIQEEQKISEAQKKELLDNSLEYVVKPGDSIGLIAIKHSIPNYKDLVLFNELLDKKLKHTGGKKQSILLKVGDVVFVPKNIEKFNKDLEALREFNNQIELNKLVSLGDREILKNEIGENIFPSAPISIGLAKILHSFIEYQKTCLTPELPRVVDERMEKTASCSHFIKMLISQSFNRKDLTPAERKFLLTQNIDAWMFPEAISKVGYSQKLDLMPYFRFESITSGYPMTKEDEELYKELVLELGKYLENAGQVGSLVPIYYRYSGSRGKVYEHNLGKKEKHLNTHMSIYAGNGEVSFVANDIGELKNGRNIPIDVLEEKKDIQIDKLKTLLTVEANPELQKKVGILDKIVTRYSKYERDETAREEMKNKIKKIFLSKDADYIRNAMKNLIKITLTDGDLEYIINLQKRDDNIILELERLNKDLEKLSKKEYIQLDLGKLGRYLQENNPLKNEIKKLNECTTNILNLINKPDFFGKSGKLPFVDFLITFMQFRGDFRSVFTPDGKKKFLEGLQKYNSLIKVYVNGKEVNISEELGKTKEEQLQIQKTDQIEITGPMVIDGVHLQNSDIADKQDNMNSRIRFFGEMVMSGFFLPTELIEPSKDTTFIKEKFGDLRDELKIKGSFSLKSGENIGESIKLHILELDKELFDKLDRNDPEYKTKHTELLNYIYAKQIKGLQLTGFLQNENKLNPRAFNVNRLIPYFDISNIDTIFRNYINQKKSQKSKENEKTSNFKTYIDLTTYPGDTYGTIYGRVLDYLKPHFNSKKYNYLKTIEGLNNYLKRKFIKEFVDNSIKSDESISSEDVLKSKVKPGTRFIIELEEIDMILEELSKVSYMEDYSPKMKPIDEDVIDFVGLTEQNKNMLRKALLLETYEIPSGKWWNPGGKRIILKKTIERNEWLEDIKNISSYGDFQIRIESIKNGFNDVWPTKKQLQTALLALFTPEAKAVIDKVKKKFSFDLQRQDVNNDLELAKKVLVLLDKDNLTKEDFEFIKRSLLTLIKINDGDNVYIVGKIISAHLANFKLNSHFQNISGFLESSGDNLDKIYANQDNAEMLENISILSYNQGELNVLFGLTENYLFRLIEKLDLEKKFGVKLNVPVIDISKGGSLVYGLDTFISHIENNIYPIIQKCLSDKNIVDGDDKILLEFILDFCKKVIHNKDNNPTLEESEKPDDERRGKRKSDVVSAIYGLTGNDEFRNILDNYNYYDEEGQKIGISSTLLPEKTELRGNSFRNTFFNYISKVDKIPYYSEK